MVLVARNAEHESFAAATLTSHCKNAAAAALSATLVERAKTVTSHWKNAAAAAAASAPVGDAGGVGPDRHFHWKKDTAAAAATAV